jgi:transcriptional regulator with XRE-family HTH domain
MAKRTSVINSQLKCILMNLGENIKLARLRRNLSSTLVAQRAGMTRVTLASIEKGEETVSLGAYANVLFSLGLEKDLLLIAKDDKLGKKLQDLELLRDQR